MDEQKNNFEELAEAAERGDVVRGEVGPRLVGWGVSLVLHGVLLLVGLLVVWSVVSEEDNSQIVPIARLGDVAGAPLRDKSAAGERSARLEEVLPRPAVRERLKPERRMERGPEVLQAPAAVSPLSALAGEAGQSPLAAEFYGTGGNARRIVYIVDASGSLIDTLDFVLAELRRSISQLSDRQEFTVLFFQEGRVLEPPPGGLKEALPGVKREVFEWMAPGAGNVRAMGGTSPVPALEQAMRYEAQLIFLLSDNITGRGQYELNQERLLGQIERMNRSRTKINTIQFVYPDPLTEAGMRGTLELIADQTGGVYRFVTADELNIR